MISKEKGIPAALIIHSYEKGSTVKPIFDVRVSKKFLDGIKWAVKNDWLKVRFCLGRNTTMSTYNFPFCYVLFLPPRSRRMDFRWRRRRLGLESHSVSTSVAKVLKLQFLVALARPVAMLLLESSRLLSRAVSTLVA